MAGSGIREYRCPAHGVFEADPGPDPEAVWSQLCPTCRALCDLTPPRCGPGIVLGSAPAVHGDVRMPYVSPYLRCPIGSKRDLREVRKARGLVELSTRDCRDAIDQADVQGTEARDDLRWRAQQTDRSLCELTAGAAIGECEPREPQRVQRRRPRPRPSRAL